MESAQRELMGLLLRHIFSLGLISGATCSKAEDLIHSGVDLPVFFRDSVCLTGEAGRYGYPQDAQ